MLDKKFSDIAFTTAVHPSDGTDKVYINALRIVLAPCAQRLPCEAHEVKAPGAEIREVGAQTGNSTVKLYYVRRGRRCKGHQ
jgi:hypothetical protein